MFEHLDRLVCMVARVFIVQAQTRTGIKPTTAFAPDTFAPSPRGASRTAVRARRFPGAPCAGSTVFLAA